MFDALKRVELSKVEPLFLELGHCVFINGGQWNEVAYRSPISDSFTGVICCKNFNGSCQFIAFIRSNINDFS